MAKQQIRLAALQRQIERLDTQLGRLRQLSNRLSWLRLAVFVPGVVLTIALYYLVGPWLFWVSGAIVLIAFGIVVRYHRRIERAIAQRTIWRILKTTQMARVARDWTHIPLSRRIVPHTDHPFETDLDIVGERSLHQLVDTAVSYEGSGRLRDWLSNTQPELTAIKERQALVGEMTRLPLFRDKLSMNAMLGSGETNVRWEGGKLLAWFEQHADTRPLRNPLILLIALAAANVILFGLNSLGAFPPIWVITFIAYMGLFFSTLRDIGDLFENAASLADALNKLSAVFRFLETYRYAKNDHLRALCAPLLDAANRPSAQLRRLTRIMAGASLERNPILWLALNVIFPWDVFFAHQLNKSKVVLQALLPIWLNVWYELEALGSLAIFGYLNPEYTFPDVTPAAAGEMILRVRELGHPLIPPDKRVCNDFARDKLGEVVIITGSNMAGKSSFLRTLGVNLCLAYAGGPVNADRFEISLFRLYTCIRVSDSVIDGLSYFYAEVKRLKVLLDALQHDHDYPLFFLIDEIFRGTNNRERLIGSRSYIRALARQNGVGVISTHDLELIKLAQEIPDIRNYHFKEEVADGRMTFDYKLRPGPSPTTNALKIMQMEGLPVEVPAESVRGYVNGNC